MVEFYMERIELMSFLYKFSFYFSIIYDKKIKLENNYLNK